MRPNVKLVSMLVATWSTMSGCGSALSTPPDAGTDVDVGGFPDSGGPPPPPVAYRLARTRSLASPIPDPTGIAFDGQMLWIMSGAGANTNKTSTLIRFDPDQLAVDRTFTFDNLMENQGAAVGGITWDGAAIWISVAGSTRNKLVTVDPASGQITRTMSSPTMLGPSDLDFDGTLLWVSSGTGQVFALDPTTGGIQRTLAVPNWLSGRDHGVAVRPGELWIGGLFDSMGVEDSTTGTALGSVVHDDGTPFSGAETGASLFIGDTFVTGNGLGITYYSVQ